MRLKLSITAAVSALTAALILIFATPQRTAPKTKKRDLSLEIHITAVKQKPDIGLYHRLIFKRITAAARRIFASKHGPVLR